MQPDSNEFNFDLPGLSELPPPELGGINDYTEPGEGQPEGASADPAALAATVAALEKRLKETEETFQKRLNDTQRWGQQQNAGRELFEAMAAMKAQEAEQARLAAQAEAAFALPTLTDDQREALVADPAVLEQHIVNVAAAMANRVYAPLAQRLQAAEAFTHIAGPMIEYQADRVAESVLAQEQIPTEQAEALKNETRQGLWHAAQGDPIKYARYNMDPQMVKWALRFALDNQPVGTRPSPRGPSIGAGEPSGGGGRRPSDAPSLSFAAAKIARDLGITFKKETLQEVQQSLKEKRR